MPIYEYQCQSCGNEIEVIQKISDPHITECSACGKSDMKKKVSAAAFRLSGSGWYETDFKSGNKKNLTEGDKSSADKKPEKASRDKVSKEKAPEKKPAKTEK